MTEFATARRQTDTEPPLQLTYEWDTVPNVITRVEAMGLAETDQASVMADLKRDSGRYIQRDVLLFQGDKTAQEQFPSLLEETLSELVARGTVPSVDVFKTNPTPLRPKRVRESAVAVRHIPLGNAPGRLGIVLLQQNPDVPRSVYRAGLKQFISEVNTVLPQKNLPPIPPIPNGINTKDSF